MTESRRGRRVRRLPVRAACVCLLWLLLPFAAQAQLHAPRTPYLDAAEGIGLWLLEVTDEGSRWPGAVAIDGTVPQTLGFVGMESGAAGIGLFFLQLHRHTGVPQHLAIAVAAAEFERMRNLEGTTGGPDYLAGAAGSGLYLLALHAATGDERYVEWAKDIAEWHRQTAVQPAPGERYWEHGPNFPRLYTGIPHGAAGIAIFHLALHHRTGQDPAYLALAEDAYRWIRNHALPLDDEGAIGFRRLASDSDVYNWWSGGSAGILQLQSMLYGATGNAQYLDDLRRTADGLVALAEPASPEGVNWTTGRPPNGFRPIVFSHGNGSVAPALMLAYEHLGDVRYRDTAQASIDWLAAVAQDGSAAGAAGLFWEHSPGTWIPRLSGAFVGSGSVGWTFARLSSLLPAQRLRSMALQSADYLLAIAEHAGDGQLRWRNYLGPENLDWAPLAFRTGWYDGNAGIGLFLLAAHEVATGQRVGLDVHAP